MQEVIGVKDQARAIIAVGTGFRVMLSAGLTTAALLVAAGPAQAETTLKVYRSHMPDGSVVLGDRPAAGARNVESSNYAVAPLRQGAAAADAEREYWRRQAEAFDQRQAMRDMRDRPSGYRYQRIRQDAAQSWGPAEVWYPGGQGAHRPLVPPHRVNPVYRSTPGAAHGRSFGFIGSGFSTAR